MNAATNSRYDALDSLRGFAMFLGIVLHAAIPYMALPVPFWPVRDPQFSSAYDVLVYAVHSFRLQTFFLLAGFFGALLVSRYGLRGFVGHRLRRVGLPLVAALLILQPLMQGIILVAEVAAHRGEPFGAEPVVKRALGQFLFTADPDPSAAYSELVVNHLASGSCFRVLLPMHLWFLYYLLMLCGLAVPIVWLGRRVPDAWFRSVAGSPGRVVILAGLTVPLLLPMRHWLSDTPIGWRPEPHILAYYALFFGFGWLLYRHRDLLPSFRRGWLPMLLLAQLLVLPLMLGLTQLGMRPEAWAGMSETARAALRAAGEVDPLPPRWPLAVKLAALTAQAIYTWMTMSGLLGGFLTLLDRPSATARWLADASYWCYLMSIPPILVMQMLVAPLPWPAAAKFLAVNVVTIAVLLATYQACVRYTLIGRVLNGRRTRPEPTVIPETRPTPVAIQTGNST